MKLSPTEREKLSVSLFKLSMHPREDVREVAGALQKMLREDFALQAVLPLERAPTDAKK